MDKVTMLTEAVIYIFGHWEHSFVNQVFEIS